MRASIGELIHLQIEYSQYSVSTRTNMGEQIQLKTLMVVSMVYLHIPVWVNRFSLRQRL